MVSLDGRGARVIAPSTRALFWKGAVEVTFEKIDALKEPEVPARPLSTLRRVGNGALMVTAAVDEGKRGLVYLDGRLIRELGAGTYGFWSAVSAPCIEVIET